MENNNKNNKVNNIPVNKQKKKQKHYLPPEKFHAEYNKCVLLGEPSAKLIHFFELIAINFSKKYNNTAQKDKACIINFGVSEAWKKWNRYDERRSTNIFSFFTTMISNDMKTHYNKIFNKDKTEKYKFVSIDKLFFGGDK